MLSHRALTQVRARSTSVVPAFFEWKRRRRQFSHFRRGSKDYDHPASADVSAPAATRNRRSALRWLILARCGRVAEGQADAVRLAAVHHQVDSRDVPGVVAGQEEGSRRDVVCRTYPAQR